MAGSGPIKSSFDTDNLCELACTQYGICVEKVNPGEVFRGGQACVDKCMKYSPADLKKYLDAVGEAERTGNCKKLVKDY